MKQPGDGRFHEDAAMTEMTTPVNRPLRTPQWLDARSLAMHRLLVEKVRREPALFDKLGQNLARWKQTAAPGTLAYLDAWQALVDQGPEACFAVAMEDSDRGQVLRSCSPFAGVLSNAERWAFLKAWAEGREGLS